MLKRSKRKPATAGSAGKSGRAVHKRPADPDDSIAGDMFGGKPVVTGPAAYAVKFEGFINPERDYRGLDLRAHELSEPEKIALGIQVSTAGIESDVTIRPLAKPDLVDFIQPPYNDSDLRKLEAAVRRNWAIRSAIMVRQFFVFGHDSDVIMELTPKDAKDMTKEEQEEFLKNMVEWQMVLEEIKARDERVGLVNAAKTFYWQGLTFGRACIIKFFQGEQGTGEVRKLFPINSRRLGEPRVEKSTYDLKAVDIDGKPVSVQSLIYSPYMDLQLSPHTEFYGYTPVEPILYAAQGLNIAVEEDIPEIMKSAWLATIILQISTEGLTPAEADAKIRTIIDAIKAGKFIGVNDAITPIPVDLKANFEGIVKLLDKVEAICYKMLSVPQFLVQNEGVANRATAIQSVQSFIDGVVTDDQMWLDKNLQAQWYQPEIQRLWQERKLGEKYKAIRLAMRKQRLAKQAEERRMKKQQDKAAEKPAVAAEESTQQSDQDDDIFKMPSDEDLMADFKEGEIPIVVRRIFQQPKAAEFIDLAAAIVQLVNAYVWDIQKANEVLGTEDVTPRVLKAKEQAVQQQQELMKAKGNEEKDDKDDREEEDK